MALRYPPSPSGPSGTSELRAAPVPAFAGLSRLERYLSVPLVFSVLGAVIFFIAWNRGIALMYALFAFMAGALALSFAGARWMLRAAGLRMTLPAHAAVGDTITVKVEVLPHGWPKRRHLVELHSPYPFAPDRHLFLPVSGRGEVYEDHVPCIKRGVFQLRTADMRCAYPLGLVGVRREWAIEPRGMTVYPRVYPIGKFSMPPSASRFAAELERPAPTIGQDLFREVREYRRGDNPRHIHWRSSAHHGELVVRQFDAVATSENWIVLDLDPAAHAGAGADHSFERAVEIAASIATRLVRAGLRCGLAGGLQQDGSPLLLVPPNTGGAHLHLLMEALAQVQPACAEPYQSVLEALAPHFRSGQQWILFQHGDGSGVTPRYLKNPQTAFWFRFDTGSFLAATADNVDDTPQPAVKTSDGYTIARNTDLALMFK
jgi:uncharacterized protein (DUF58 family)